MARPDTKQATETLQEVNSVFDRIAEWVATNPALVMSAIGGVLALAAIAGVADWRSRATANQAAASVAAVQAEYFAAMGATPGSVEVPEPANPEAVQGIREEYVQRFLEVADEHSGSVASISALMEAATLSEQLGDSEGALSALERASEEARSGSALRGLVLERLAQSYEDNGKDREAAGAYEQAGEITSLPSRKIALMNAGRVWARVGDDAHALELFDQAEALESDAAVPDHLTFRMQEVRARAATATP